MADKDWATIKPERRRLLNIKGTSGSGKTTIVYRLLSQYTHRTPYFIPGRRMPLGYVFETKGRRPLAVIGHYDAGSAGCGGLDSVPTYAAMVEMMKLFWDLGYHVLGEGLLASGDNKQTRALHRMTGGQIRVIGLTTSLAQCLAAINARRRAKNVDAEDVDPANTISKMKAVPATLARCREAGIQVKEADREEAWIWTAKIFGHDPQTGWTVGDSDPTWINKEAVHIKLQTLDERGERVPGLVYDAESNSFRINAKALERELKMLELKNLKRGDRKAGAGTDGALRPRTSYGSMAAPTDDSDPAYRAQYRAWRQARRQERKARKSATALGQPWPPVEGMYSTAWHAQEKARWEAAQVQAEGPEEEGKTEGTDSAGSGMQVQGPVGKAVKPLVAGQGVWTTGYLQRVEEEVQFLSLALADALKRLDAARGR